LLFCTQIPSDELRFLIDVLLGSAVELCCHPFGCRVIQRALECCDVAHSASLVAVILSAGPRLLDEQYGHYVLQHLIQHGRDECRSAIFSFISGHVVTLSTHKHASSVMERCLQYLSPEQRKALIDEVVEPSYSVFQAAPGRSLPADPQNWTPVQVLASSPFGNFVLQRMLDGSVDVQRRLLLEMLWSYAPMLRRYSWGKHILTKMESAFYGGST
jgi:pumilio RNA-binding family